MSALRCSKYDPPSQVPDIALRMPILDRELHAATLDIYALGPRPLYELFRELRRGAELPWVIRRYARLNRDDRFRGILNELDGRRLY
jgi:hypothetical protein